MGGREVYKTRRYKRSDELLSKIARETSNVFFMARETRNASIHNMRSVAGREKLPRVMPRRVLYRCVFAAVSCL